MRHWNKRLWDKQKGLCFYCGCRLRKNNLGNVRNREHPDWNRIATLDHVIPRSVLMPDVADHFYRMLKQQDNPNLVYACRACNERKGCNLPEGWDGRLGPYQLVESGWMWVGYPPDELQPVEGV